MNQLRTAAAVTAANPVRRKPIVRNAPQPPAKSKGPVQPAEPGKLPVYLPRNVVLMLRDLCEDAASLRGGADDFVDAMIGDMVRETAADAGNGDTGIIDAILSAYEFPDIAGMKQRLIGTAKKWEGRL